MKTLNTIEKLQVQSYEILGTAHCYGYKDAYLETQGGGILGVIIPALMNETAYAVITPNWGLGLYHFEDSGNPIFDYQFDFDDEEELVEPLWSETALAIDALNGYLKRMGF